MDQSVHDLLDKISRVYAFLIGDGILAKVTQMKELLSKISDLTLECVQFVKEYSENENFCMSCIFELQCSANVSL